MAWSLLWRFFRTLLAVWALASVVFLLSHHDTATAAQFALPDSSEYMSSGSVQDSTKYQAAQTAVLQRLGLDLPVFYVGRKATSSTSPIQWQWHGFANQYHRWITGVLKGDLGTSFRTGQAVGTRLLHALAYTLPLTGTAALLAILAALALAQRLAAGPWWLRPVRSLLVTLHALPLFVVALLLLLAFANPEVFAWFPAYGLDQPTNATLNIWARSANYLLHMVLPITALTLTALPDLTLQLTAALTHELRTDYAATARAKGLSGSAVIRQHALRNALLPTLTQIAELLPALVAGALVVETVFALPGMGRLLADAAATRDYPVLVGGVLLTGAARLLALLLADLLYLWVDPRIRWQS